MEINEITIKGFRKNNIPLPGLPGQALRSSNAFMKPFFYK